MVSINVLIIIKTVFDYLTLKLTVNTVHHHHQKLATVSQTQAQRRSMQCGFVLCQ